MNKTISIPCHSCAGKGERRLPEKYAATLETLKRLKCATCQRVHDAMVETGTIEFGSTKTLVLTHKRMSQLVSWGLAKKVRKIKPSGDLRKAAWEFQAI